MKSNKRIVANSDIRVSSVRLIGDNVNKVMPTKAARQQAESDGLDLVVVNESSDPIVVKIVNLDQYRYEQSRREKEQARAARDNRVQFKEVQFKPNIDEHDFNVKCRKISKFIKSGNIVKLQVQFKGRERQHSDLGFELINRVLDTVETASLDGKPQFAGNRITAIIKGQ